MENLKFKIDYLKEVDETVSTSYGDCTSTNYVHVSEDVDIFLSFTNSQTIKAALQRAVDTKACPHKIRIVKVEYIKKSEYEFDVIINAINAGIKWIN
jgi:hypothetical protein